MAERKLWKLLLLGSILIVYLIACGEPPTPEPTATQVPPTEIPATPTRTPFPASCEPADSTTLDLIKNLEATANEKNVAGTMILFSADAILDETFRGVHLDTQEKIKGLWEGYYKVSLPCEFKDIKICENMATFTWAELGAASHMLWPVVIEVTDGKISYLDFYEDGTRVQPEE